MDNFTVSVLYETFYLCIEMIPLLSIVINSNLPVTINNHIYKGSEYSDTA